MNETESQPDLSWYELNKDRAKANAKAWREANPDRFRELKRKWAWLHRKKVARKRSVNPLPELSEQEYLDLLASQGGRCAICDRLPTPKRKFQVDREYLTGKVRGLLCKDCFLGVFSLKTIKFVEYALKYMKNG